MDSAPYKAVEDQQQCHTGTQRPGSRMKHLGIFLHPESALDIRCTLALGRALRSVDVPVAARLIDVAMWHANMSGYWAGYFGNECPTQIASDVALSTAWALGHSEGAEVRESMLDESAWRQRCGDAARHANAGCGLSHDYYVDRFSAAIDGLLAVMPPHQHERALSIAREWDYATPQERAEAADQRADDGCCSHGIELGCCPAGCGSGPDEGAEDFDDYDATSVDTDQVA